MEYCVLTGYTVYIDGWSAVLSESLKVSTDGDVTMYIGESWRSVWGEASHQKTIM